MVVVVVVIVVFVAVIVVVVVIVVIVVIIVINVSGKKGVLSKPGASINFNFSLAFQTGSDLVLMFVFYPLGPLESSAFVPDPS